MLKKAVVFILLFIFGFFNLGFTQTSTSQVERAQETLEREKALREKLERPQKIYVKKIATEGIILLSPEEVEEIVSSFQKRWLTEEDIQEILILIKEAYEQKGYAERIIKISYQIKDRQLIITVVESAPKRNINFR